MRDDNLSGDSVRADRAQALAARRAVLDDSRQSSVARQHERGRQTARENIAQFADSGSFVEYGGLAKPARADMDGPADGLVMGTATVDGAPVVLAAYDYTVHAGTQSATNHRKMDRLFELAERNRWPVVGWWDGGGARPHDMLVAGRPENPGFVTFARLSGLVPTVTIVSGRAFAGQANLAGLSDVIIATTSAAMGMAGPPLVEAALGHKLSPEEIGPMSVHEAAGAIDVLVESEADALAAARLYLSFFRGPQAPGEAPDALALRDVIPENPRRAYNVRKVVAGIADIGSVLELRPNFSKAAVTALARIEGRPVAIIANQPMFLAGAMDSPACDKIARFIGLADAYDLPLVFLCDTPGLMVGPEVEKTALVRHSAPHPDRCGQRHRADADHRVEEGLWARLLRHGGDELSAQLYRRLADSGIRRHGHRRRGQHHPQIRTRRRCGRSGARGPPCRTDRGPEGAPHSVERGRQVPCGRRHRPGREPSGALAHAGQISAASAAQHPQAPDRAVVEQAAAVSLS